MAHRLMTENDREIISFGYIAACHQQEWGKAQATPAVLFSIRVDVGTAILHTNGQEMLA